MGAASISVSEDSREFGESGIMMAQARKSADFPPYRKIKSTPATTEVCDSMMRLDENRFVHREIAGSKIEGYIGGFSSIEESFRKALGLRRGTNSSRKQDSYSCAAREKCRRKKEEEGKGGKDDEVEKRRARNTLANGCP